MRFTVYPWDLKSWRSAFRISGLPGVAIFCLMLGSMLQVEAVSGAGGGAGHSSAGAIIFIRFPAILIAFFVLLYRPHIAPIRLFDLRFAYGAFAGLYILSTLWSAMRIETLGKGAELCMAGLVFFEASRGDDAIRRVEGLRQIIILTMSTLGMLAVLGFLARIPAFVQHRAGIISSTTAQAPFLSGNGLGYVASALILVVFAEWQVRRLSGKAAIGQIFFAMALFSVSASRTSFGILLLSVLMVVFKKSRLIGALVALGVVLAATLFSSEIIDRLQGHQNSSSFVTLSGRTVVWSAAVRQFEEYPVLGIGGGVGGKNVISHIGNMYLEQMSSLHNGFLEVLTGLGLVGFLIAVYMLMLATWRAWIVWDRCPEFAGTYVLIIHVWMTTTMSTGLLGWMGYEVAIFLCIITNLDLVMERARVRAHLPTPVRWSAQALQPQNESAT